MRVVWITHNYPRFAGDIAGAFLHPLAVALRARNVDVRVVAPSDAGQGGRDELDGVPVRRMRYGTTSTERIAYRGTMADTWRSPGSLAAIFRLRAALRRGALAELADAAPGDRVVHAHWWIPGGLAAPRTVPFVLTSHGTDVRLLDNVPFSAWLARPVYRRARVVTTVSHALAGTIQRRTGVAVDRDGIQPMPVLDVPRPWTDRSGGLVAIGRLSAQKRWHLALDAFALLRNADPALTLTLVGDGPERAALERHAAQIGVTEALTFAGEVAPSRVPEFLATATCCLMPARHEGFGLAAAEALMQGVPVVACTDGGGLLDVVSAPRGGRVVAPDGSAIATAVSTLVADPASFASARVVGEGWRDMLAPAHVAQRCMTWYDRALHA